MARLARQQAAPVRLLLGASERPLSKLPTVVRLAALALPRPARHDLMNADMRRRGAVARAFSIFNVDRKLNQMRVSPVSAWMSFSAATSTSISAQVL